MLLGFCVQALERQHSGRSPARQHGIGVTASGFTKHRVYVCNYIGNIRTSAAQPALKASQIVSREDRQKNMGKKSLSHCPISSFTNDSVLGRHPTWQPGTSSWALTAGASSSRPSTACTRTSWRRPAPPPALTSPSGAATSMDLM